MRYEVLVCAGRTSWCMRRVQVDTCVAFARNASWRKEVWKDTCRCVSVSKCRRNVISDRLNTQWVQNWPLSSLSWFTNVSFVRIACSSATQQAREFVTLWAETLRRCVCTCANTRATTTRVAHAQSSSTTKNDSRSYLRLHLNSSFLPKFWNKSTSSSVSAPHGRIAHQRTATMSFVSQAQLQQVNHHFITL